MCKKEGQRWFSSSQGLLQDRLVVGSGQGILLTALRAALSLRYWPRTRCRSGSEGHRACLRLLRR